MMAHSMVIGLFGDIRLDSTDSTDIENIEIILGLFWSISTPKSSINQPKSEVLAISYGRKS